MTQINPLGGAEHGASFTRGRAPLVLVAVGAAAVCLAANPPFWEAKNSDKWTLPEAQSILADSPWAQQAAPGPQGPGVRTYIATADPVIAAEDRLRASLKEADSDSSWEEYREYLREGTGKYIIIAVAAGRSDSFAEADETNQMLKETKLRIGKRTARLVGHFQPSSSDPYVRFVFDRDIRPGDGAMRFQVYVPGMSQLYYAEFRLKDLVYHGKPSY